MELPHLPDDLENLTSKELRDLAHSWRKFELECGQVAFKLEELAKDAFKRDRT